MIGALGDSSSLSLPPLVRNSEDKEAYRRCPTQQRKYYLGKSMELCTFRKDDPVRSWR